MFRDGDRNCVDESRKGHLSGVTPDAFIVGARKESPERVAEDNVEIPGAVCFRAHEACHSRSPELFDVARDHSAKEFALGHGGDEGCFASDDVQCFPQSVGGHFEAEACVLSVTHVCVACRDSRAKAFEGAEACERVEYVVRARVFGEAA